MLLCPFCASVVIFIMIMRKHIQTCGQLPNPCERIHKISYILTGQNYIYTTKILNVCAYHGTKEDFERHANDGKNK